MTTSQQRSQANLASFLGEENITQHTHSQKSFVDSNKVIKKNKNQGYVGRSKVKDAHFSIKQQLIDKTGNREV